MLVSVTLADRVQKTMKAAWQELDGETVLLVAGEEKLLGLNLGSYPQAGQPIDPSPNGPLGPP